MSITKRKPESVDQIIREEFTDGLKLTPKELEEGRTALEEITKNKGGITEVLAKRLSIVFRTTPEFWLNIQKDNDEWEEANKEG